MLPLLLRYGPDMCHNNCMKEPRWVADIRARFTAHVNRFAGIPAARRAALIDDMVAETVKATEAGQPLVVIDDPLAPHRLADEENAGQDSTPGESKKLRALRRARDRMGRAW
jgi:hypothetical protein